METAIQLCQVYAYAMESDATRWLSSQDESTSDFRVISHEGLSAISGLPTTTEDSAIAPADLDVTDPTRAYQFADWVQRIHDHIDLLPARFQPPMRISTITEQLRANAVHLRERLSALRGYTEISAWWHVRATDRPNQSKESAQVDSQTTSGTHYMNYLRKRLQGVQTQEGARGFSDAIASEIRFELKDSFRDVRLRRQTIDSADSAESRKQTMDMIVANVMVERSCCNDAIARLQCMLVQKRRALLVNGPSPLYSFYGCDRDV
jgi:hypothetical protein